MTHPVGSLTIPPPNTVSPSSSHTDTHATEDNQTTQSTSTSGVVNDYLIVPQDDPNRPAIYTSGDLYAVLATTKETNFGFNAFDFFVPMGGGPPPHIHNYEHEAFFVKEGNVGFFLGNEAGVPGASEEFILNGLPPGTFLFGPRLRPHGFANPNSTAATSGTNKGARVLSLTTPSGLDLLLEFAGIPVTSRNDPIPSQTPGIDPKQLEFGQRTGGGVAFPGYEPPDGTPNYVLVLPVDAPQALKENIESQLAGVDGFSISTYNERPKFTGPFGIEYTSLASFQETGNELSYNQFSLAPQATDTFVQANLTSSQVVEPTESLASGVATLEINSEGDGLDYSLTVTGLDFGNLVEGGTPQTPDNNDDVTAIYIDSGERGSNGSHAFNILAPSHQDENDLRIASNSDGSTTISSTWNQAEEEIPTTLSDFLDNSGLPGQESNFYFQIHTEGHLTGEIRGQIARTTDDFPNPVESENHELFYVREGQLSLKIGDEIRLAEPDTFVYVAPGNEYSIGNFGETEVESLAVSVIQQAEERVNIGNEQFPSPLNPQSSISPNELVFLSDGDDIFDNPNDSRCRIYGGRGNDELFANKDDRLFGEEGNDLLDASGGLGGNRLYGGEGEDELFANKDDRLFGGEGDDFLDASVGEGHNRLDGSEGNDDLLAGSNDQLVGGNGDDILRIISGSDNLLYGGSGADQFWIVNGRLPDTLPETRQLTDFGLPPLEDTRNTIVDFEQGIDKIHIGAISGISSFDDLKLLPAFGDIRSTSLLATVDGIEGEISLANVSGILFNELSAGDFVFA